MCPTHEYAEQHKTAAAVAPLLRAPGAPAADGSAAGAPGAREWSTAALVAARAGCTAANVALHFPKAPLHVVRGAAQLLYDAEGASYLDCVNNVAHVGHCQADVADALCEQLRTLNTNSRYLQRYLVEYAEQLCATLPPALRVLFWCNSGSEANDLALRLAREHTRRRGVICVGGAYHGHVSSMVDASPYKYERAGGAGQRCVACPRVGCAQAARVGTCCEDLAPCCAQLVGARV
jgi:4-aminobutyrate aminotransferase-like enzyme